MAEKMAKDNINAQFQTKSAIVGNIQEKEGDNVSKNAAKENSTDKVESMKNQNEGDDGVMSENQKTQGFEDTEEEDYASENEGTQTLEEIVHAAIKESKSKTKNEPPDNEKPGTSFEKDAADEEDAQEFAYGDEDADYRDVEEQRRQAKMHLVRLLAFILMHMVVVCVVSMYADEIYAFVDLSEEAVSALLGVDRASGMMTNIYMGGAILQLFLAWLLHRKLAREDPN